MTCSVFIANKKQGLKFQTITGDKLNICRKGGLKMAYIVLFSNDNGREAKVIQSEEAVTKLIEEKIKEGMAEESIQVYSGEQVPFQVEKVPVVKLKAVAETVEATSSATTEEATKEEEENANTYSGFAKFNEEQVFSLDS